LAVVTAAPVTTPPAPTPISTGMSKVQNAAAGVVEAMTPTPIAALDSRVISNFPMT
jgi:hypothetical protein